MTDPIADMLIRIKNASQSRHDMVSIPFSKIKFEIARILKRENYIEDFVKRGKGNIKHLEVTLRFEKGQAATPQSRQPIISDVKRISRLGQRIYKGWQDIRLVKGGYGLSVISTSKGLMTDKGARKAKVGGEVLFEIW